ncbi:MAG TPA: RNA 2',3'-cyclic phosphodiesterase [Candidatus Synoicihabitans sp.]|nr:RNA 2',3'-cyclic phosphodiesterase [Candidatus Synoicihabitans sp.]
MRLFVALLPTDATRRALAKLDDRRPGFRWTPAEQVHVTMRFLGELSPELAEQAEDALARVRVDPFWVEVGGVGRFPPHGRANVVWGGLSQHHPRLHQLRQQIDDGLLAAGIPIELSPFVPHFTVARVREAAPEQVTHWLKRHRDFAGPAWHVDSFALMDSVLGATGAEHHVRRMYPLTGASSAPAN